MPNHQKVNVAVMSQAESILLACMRRTESIEMETHGDYSPFEITSLLLKSYEMCNKEHERIAARGRRDNIGMVY